MALRYEHDHGHEPVGHGHPVAITSTTSYWERFSAAQAVALAMGIFFIVIGVVGLARSGADAWTQPVVHVAALRMTPLLATIHIAIGLVALFGTVGPASGRSAALFLGTLLVAGGIIALIQQFRALGWDDVNGIAYLIAGVAGLVAAIMTPVASIGAVEERMTTH